MSFNISQYQSITRVMPIINVREIEDENLKQNYPSLAGGEHFKINIALRNSIKHVSEP